MDVPGIPQFDSIVRRGDRKKKKEREDKGLRPLYLQGLRPLYLPLSPLYPSIKIEHRITEKRMMINAVVDAAINNKEAI